VGVYVQMSVSVPIFIGGLVRWMVDRIMRKSPALAHVSGQGEDDDASRAHAQVQAIAEAESSPGVLLASGYIAGGTLGGVLIAFMEFAPKFKERLDYSQRVEHSWGNADWPALLAFAGLIALLILVGAGQVLKSQPPATVQSPGVTNGGGRL